MNFKVVPAFVVVIGLACCNQEGKKETTLPAVADNTIVGIVDGRFAFLTYENYNKLKITADTKEQKFTMSIVAEKDNNYDFIKKPPLHISHPFHNGINLLKPPL